jgi:hypothetical protein
VSTTSTKSSNGNPGAKYEKAVADARAKESGEAAAHGDPGEAMVLPKGAEAMILRPSADDIAALMNDDTMEFAPQVKKLEEGDMIRGHLEGYGPPVELSQTDAQGRPVTNHVNTWILRSPNGSLRMSILSSVQLDKKLKPFIGDMVSIYRGKDVKTGTAGRRVTEYLVGGPKRKDGTLRSWVDSSPGSVIDADSTPVSIADAHVAGALTGGEDARA